MRILQGEGEIVHTNANPYMVDESCWPQYQCGNNTYDITIGPLCPGSYKLKLMTRNWDWSKQYPDDYCIEQLPNDYWNDETPGWATPVSKQLTVGFQCPNNSIRPVNLYAFDPIKGTCSYNECILGVTRNYEMICVLRTNLSEAYIPRRLSGQLLPQDGINTDLTFERDPEHDYTPCDVDAPFKDYAYSSQNFKPFNLWHYSDEQWMTMAKRIRCEVPALPNRLDTCITANFTVISLLNLDCLNDTSVCFVPANKEGIDFIFRYSRATNLYCDSDVHFIVQNANNNIVYDEPLTLPNLENVQDYWGLPGFHGDYYSVPLRWDGRINKEENPNYGHLADPDSCPYTAYVEGFTPLLDNARTNDKQFYLAPKIDSIILTHYPSYPPPKTGETTTLYAIIRGRSDDNMIPWLNYKYYRGPGVEGPNVLNAWDGITYHFNDLPSSLQQYYYEYNGAQELPLREWNEFWWGLLKYTWYVYHDRRYRLYVENQITYDRIDTSFFSNGWGHNWKVDLSTPTNWFLADEIPYMRILAGVGISDHRNGYLVQDNESDADTSAHKIIFSASNHGIPDFDIVDWAITHIGVAYERSDGAHKNPYRRIECSGLVTTTKIQDIGSEQNQIYHIGYILANDYARGKYSFGLQNIDLPLITVSGLENTMRGDIITFTPIGDTKATHVGIIESIYYNATHDPNEWDACIISARGWTRTHFPNRPDPEPENGRVKFEDLLNDYDEEHYTFKYLRFTE